MRYFVTITSDTIEGFTPRKRIAITGFIDALEYIAKHREAFGADNICAFIEHS